MLRFHDPNDEDWTLQSYVPLTTITTVNEFWSAHKCLKDKLKLGIFFLMRSDAFPSWDSDANINGGVLSIKVLKENVEDYVQQLCVRMLGETLFVPELKDKWDMINGISTSPKRYFCIVKIWMRTNDFPDKKFFRLPDTYYGDIIYRENMDNIQKNHDA